MTAIASLWSFPQWGMNILGLFSKALRKKNIVCFDESQMLYWIGKGWSHNWDNHQQSYFIHIKKI
jgi:pyruvate/2-oxoglutarate/acetoin dehydrogenase E1 component